MGNPERLDGMQGSVRRSGHHRITGRPKARLRVALVGLGYWGPNLLRVMTDMPDIDLAWLCDLDESRLETYGPRAPHATLTRSLDEVLLDPQLDAVILATPVHSHHALASRVLEAGKHIFVEKPLAPSSKQAEELIGHATAQGVRLMCGHTFLYSPAVRAVHDMISQGELGAVYFVSSSRVNLGLHQRDTSVIWDLGPHDFSILLYWLGEVPLAVRAVGRDSIVSGIADVAFVTLTFGSGIVANIELSWLAPSKLRRTVVVGANKMIVYEDGTPEPIRLYDHGVVYRDPNTFGEYHLSYRTGDIVSPKVDTYEPLSSQLSEFFSAARGNDGLDLHVQLARDVVRLTEAADESLRAGGAEIAVQGPDSQPPFARRRGDRPLRDPDVLDTWGISHRVPSPH